MKTCQKLKLKIPSIHTCQGHKNTVFNYKTGHGKTHRWSPCPCAQRPPPSPGPRQSAPRRHPRAACRRGRACFGEAVHQMDGLANDVFQRVFLIVLGFVDLYLQCVLFFSSEKQHLKCNVYYLEHRSGPGWQWVLEYSGITCSKRP